MTAASCSSMSMCPAPSRMVSVLSGRPACNARLKAGGVMDDDQIDAYIELKMEEVIKFEHTPHPVEFEMYYSA